jgi:alkylated DNA repair dioxygenase AlkB
MNKRAYEGTEGAEHTPAMKKARPAEHTEGAEHNEGTEHTLVAKKARPAESTETETPEVEPFAFIEQCITAPDDPETFLRVYQCSASIMLLIMTIINAVCDQLIVRPPITVFGKKCHQPRDVGFYSNESTGYKYSGQTMVAQPLTAAMSKLISDVNGHFGTNFNGILINRYENGYSNIGKHSDNENGICPFGGVISISVGATRIFRLRDKESNSIVKDVLAVNGQAIQMAGEFQKVFTHEIPVEPRVETPRYSFTLRCHEKEGEVVPKRTRVRKSGAPRRTRVRKSGVTEELVSQNLG